ncbi:MAG: DUF1501 domain-containing protein [Lewinellaceae bacterium]|nr:DUF1501 domain-containing protein [Saprospiraceae bacterium]MCB9342492.1 DUF1501 domain-containing protein [Lewinellaceae bacterium]
MKRRNFLKILPAAGVTSFAVNGYAMRPFANSKMARVLNSCDGVEDRVLVLIQLKGGNDGVNTVIPVNQYDTYANLRPSIAIPQNNLIDLDNTLGINEQVGLHPSMQKIKELYDDGKAAIVQGVGYQDMNQSHFKGTDLWMSGGDGTPANNNISTGWMGRSLQAFYPDVVGVPTSTNPDPLGIQIGDPNPNLGFHTDTEHQNLINMSGQDPSGFFSLIQTIGGAPIMNVPDSDHGEELAFIMGVEQSTNLYAQRISDVFNAGTNSLDPYPTTVTSRSSLGQQLKTIARLISGGCKTKIYLCQLTGFDTHSSQVDGGSPTVGDHADLLTELAEAVKNFNVDLDGLGLADHVLTCTFSEFGRCAKGNASDGTDHGTLAPMMLFGKNVQAGVSGTNVNLSNLTNDNQLQGMQFDYRQVFTTILQDWLGASEDVLTDVMFSGYQKMPLVDTAFVVSPDCYLPMSVGIFDNYVTKKPLTVFPNPANAISEVAFEHSGGSFDARLSIHSLGGSIMSTMYTKVNQGNNSFLIDLSILPPGTYFVRLENKATGKAEVAKLQVVR